MIRKPLFFKHKPKYSHDQGESLIIMLRKDGKTLDSRYKDTREFIYQGMNTRFSDFMQRLSVLMGNNKQGQWTISWRHYFHPIKQIRYRITGVWYLS